MCEGMSGKAMGELEEWNVFYWMEMEVSRDGERKGQHTHVDDVIGDDGLAVGLDDLRESLN
jgi:hypothetical protein